MFINYWLCSYSEYEEYLDDNHEEVRIYGCTHPDNKLKICELENKCCGAEDECKFITT